jgi:membrane-bound lytic murein transglycosylase D
VVKKGDFLTLLAKKNKVSIDDLKAWNALTDNNLIVGQKLIVGKVPITEPTKELAEAAPKKKAISNTKKAKLHYVKKGDSLYSIAKKYPGITITDIKRWNGIKNENIKPGMKLKING